MSLTQAIDEAVDYVRAHPDQMTSAEMEEFRRLAQTVYLLAFRTVPVYVYALPKVPEMRPELESQDPPLPPVQFVTKLNLPGDWDRTSSDDDAILPPTRSLVDDIPEPPEPGFLVCASPRWFADMASLRTLADQGATLIERVLAVLTSNQGHIMQYLWEKKTASYETLRTIPQAWRDVPSDAAVTKALKDMRTRLEAAELLAISIVISDAKQRVNLELPADLLI